MTPKKPTTVAQYLAELPSDRRQALQAVRRVINENLGPAFEEGMQHGMPAFFLPHSVYPAGYHCDKSQPLPFASVAWKARRVCVETAWPSSWAGVSVGVVVGEVRALSVPRVRQAYQPW